MSAKNRGKSFQPAVLLPPLVTKAIAKGNQFTVYKNIVSDNYIAACDHPFSERFNASGLTPAGAILALERALEQEGK
jgi:hypothetical protein